MREFRINYCYKQDSGSLGYVVTILGERGPSFLTNVMLFVFTFKQPKKDSAWTN